MAFEPSLRSLRRVGLAPWLLATGFLLTGCGLSCTETSHEAAPVPIVAGRVHGGQQPVSGARIQLFAAGLIGAGAGATDLTAAHTIVTDTSGSFTIAGDFSCPAFSTQVYLVASGGNPGLAAGTSNPALVLMAALGDCGELSASTYIWVNEVTTVAAAWALSQFLAPGAQVGASISNTTGLRNAFLTAGTLADTSTGSAPAAVLPAGTAIETNKINTLADALAPCVNSPGGAACASLFSLATGAFPATTLDAALAIVRNPSSSVDAVFQLAQADAPFQPALGIAPNDWTLSVTFGGCSNGCGGLNLPGGLGIDAGGDVWVANYFGGVVSEFSPLGVPVAPNGFPGVGLHQSSGLAIDPLGNVWVTNENSVGGANNSHVGSVSKFDSTGNELSGYGFTGGGIYYPESIASDAAGNVWIANYGDSSASLLRNSGTAVSGANGYAPSMLPFTSAVAIDASQNAWFATQQAAAKVTAAGAVTRYSCCVDAAGIAIDAAGDVWLADYGGAAIVKLSPNGAIAAQISSANGSDAAQGIAIDSAGTVWAANFRGDSITEISGTSATLLSPAGGFGLDAPLNEPFGIAIDSSGNLWLSNFGGSTLTEMVGLAAPVLTPRIGPAVAP